MLTLTFYKTPVSESDHSQQLTTDDKDYIVILFLFICFNGLSQLSCNHEAQQTQIFRNCNRNKQKLCIQSRRHVSVRSFFTCCKVCMISPRWCTIKFWNYVSLFYFLITYGVCKKRNHCNHMIEKKYFSPFDECSCFVCLRIQNKQKKFRLSVCLAVRTWTCAVDTITFEGVSGSKQNLASVFYVWNVALVLKSKVKSWSWSWSWSWTGFWFWQKLCETTPNFVTCFSIWSITFLKRIS